MPDPLGAGVGGAHPRTRRPAGLFALPADRGPVPPGSRLQVQRPELIDAEDHFRIAVLRGRFPVGDGIQLLDPGLLLRVVRVLGGFPGFQALKGGAFLSEQDPQALVADVVDHPPQPPRNRPAWPGSRWRTAGQARPAWTWRSS